MNYDRRNQAASRGQNVTAKSGCRVNIRGDGSVSIADIPQDPYGQVYDTNYIDTRGPKRTQRAAYDFVRKNMSSLQRMTRPKAVAEIDKAMQELGLKPLRWGYYIMPD